MAIERLLGPVPARDFLDNHYLKTPFARAGGCHHVVCPPVETLLAVPGVNARASRLGRLWEGGKAPSPEQARPLLDDGYTLAVRGAERADAGLAALAAGFRADLHAPIDVHVYCTPAGQPGLGWHYDAEEVFVLQTAGSKEWSLRKNTVHPWPLVEAMPADMRHEREITPVMRCLLRAGDWLYVPGGYWHRTEAGAEESVSLSVGVMATTAIDVYDSLRRRLLTDLRWRQRLPPGAGVEAYRELFANLGRDLAEVLSREATARDFLKEREGGER